MDVCDNRNFQIFETSLSRYKWRSLCLDLVSTLTVMLFMLLLVLDPLKTNYKIFFHWRVHFNMGRPTRIYFTMAWKCCTFKKSEVLLSSIFLWEGKSVWKCNWFWKRLSMSHFLGREKLLKPFNTFVRSWSVFWKGFHLSRAWGD